MKDGKEQFWEWCAKLTDFELCGIMATAAENLPFEKRLWPHIVVDQLWSFQGLTEGEGLAASSGSCFLEGVALAPIAEGYDVIGLPAHAQIVWKLASITVEANSADRNRRDDACLFQDTEDFISFASERLNLAESEKVFFDPGAEFVRHLAVFVRSNLTKFEPLDIDLSPPERDPPNIGYLSSMLFWIRDYAHKNAGAIPSISQLIDHAMHSGIKRVTSATHTILLEGALPGDPNARLIRYAPAGARKSYVISVGGSIAEEPRENETPS